VAPAYVGAFFVRSISVFAPFDIASKVNNNIFSRSPLEPYDPHVPRDERTGSANLALKRHAVDDLLPPLLLSKPGRELGGFRV
jgi:hypothetical protein